MEKRMDFKLATQVDITTNYVGEVASGIIAESFKEADTIDKGMITVLTNIAHGKGYIRLIEGSNGMVDYVCGWNPTGDLELTEKPIEPKKLMIEQEFCYEDFSNTWSSYQMGYSAWNDSVPTDIREAILNRMLNELHENIDQYIWTGTTASGQFQGLIPKLEADPDVIDIAGVTSSVANVNAELTKVYNAIPANLFKKKDLVIAVSQNVYKNYVADQYSKGYQWLFNNNNEEMVYFNTVPLVMLNGLPDNTMVAYRISNFYLGTALTSDYNEVRIVDTNATLLDGKGRYKVVFSAATQYGFGGEVVLYNI